MSIFKEFRYLFTERQLETGSVRITRAPINPDYFKKLQCFTLLHEALVLGRGESLQHQCEGHHFHKVVLSKRVKMHNASLLRLELSSSSPALKSLYLGLRCCSLVEASFKVFHQGPRQKRVLSAASFLPSLLISRLR